MTSLIRAAIASLFLVTSGAQAASISTITFDDQPEVYFSTPIVDSGFEFASNYDGFGTNNNRLWPSNGTMHLMSWTNRGSESGFDMASTAGDLFNVHSFDFAGGYVRGSNPVNSLEVTGWLDGVQVDTATFVSGTDFLTGASYSTLDIEFFGIDQLTVTAFGRNNRANFENFKVSAVPVPAAVWLLGSALAGLGWLRRKPAA